MHKEQVERVIGLTSLLIVIGTLVNDSYEPIKRWNRRLTLWETRKWDENYTENICEQNGLEIGL